MHGRSCSQACLLHSVQIVIYGDFSSPSVLLRLEPSLTGGYWGIQHHCAAFSCNAIRVMAQQSVEQHQVKAVL